MQLLLNARIKGWSRAKKEALIKSDWHHSSSWPNVAPDGQSQPRHPEVRVYARLDVRRASKDDGPMLHR